MKKIFLTFILSSFIFGYSDKFKNDIEYNMVNIHESNFKSYKTIYIGDGENNKYYSYQENKLNPLASLTKLMTAIIVFDDINNGKYSLNTEVKTVESASIIPYGYKIKKDVIYTVDDLLKLLLINSSNSAAYQLAYLSSDGDVDSFVLKMNEKARTLNLSSLRFYTPNGLPPVDTKKKMDIGNARDIYRLAINSLKYKGILAITSNSEVILSDGTKIKSTNPLMSRYNELMGLKTGYHSKARYNIIYYMDFGKEKVVSVVLGSDTIGLRSNVGINIIETMKGIK